jgi:1-deoxy-D-xylulose-5-phosphate synthase
VTGDDGPSHHGILDMVLGLSIPDLAVFAPSEPAEIAPMLEAARLLDGPALIRYPKTPGPGRLAAPGSGLTCRVLREGGEDVVLVGIGKLAKAALEAAELLGGEGIDVTVIDPRVVRPLDPALLERAGAAALVVTVEDGLVHGGAGAYLAECLDAAAAARAERGPLVVRLGVPTSYLPHGKPDVILARLGLDGAGIASATRAGLTRLGRGEPSVAEAPRSGAGGALAGASRGRVAR